MADSTNLSIFSCKTCRTPIARRDLLLSKTYQEELAWCSVQPCDAHIFLGPIEERELKSGIYALADVCCETCGDEIGLKYLIAYNEGQKHKEGKILIPKAKILKEY